MQKTILITGSTDGIGLETAKKLVAQGHHVILHGRSSSKLLDVQRLLAETPGEGRVESILADLSSMAAIDAMATDLLDRFSQLDVLINNAGVYSSQVKLSQDKLDIRFAVNTFAPYQLTAKLMPLLGASGRVVNLSSAAQSRVDLGALSGQRQLSDGEAYAQSKLALTMWSRALGLKLQKTGPMLVSVNPKSLLASKMVKDAFGIAGNDLSLGADILVRAALSDEFSTAHGLYFDNDVEAFSAPHPDALDDIKVQQVIDAIEVTLANHL